MKILTSKEHEILSELFKDLLKRKWKTSHIDTSLVEESMKVMTYSFEKEVLTKQNKKEIFDISQDLVKQILLHYLNNREKLNPVVVLASPTALHLCEIRKGSVKDMEKFSLVGKYAKQHKCFSAVFTIMLSQVNGSAAYMVSLAYDENLTFPDGKDASLTFCVPAFEEGKKAQMTFINFSHSDIFTENIIQNMRKPSGDIGSLKTVNFN